MPQDRSGPPADGCAVPPSEAARWCHRYHEAVEWTLRLHRALEGCRGALDAAGSAYEPPGGWDLLLQLPDL